MNEEINPRFIELGVAFAALKSYIPKLEKIVDDCEETVNTYDWISSDGSNRSKRQHQRNIIGALKYPRSHAELIKSFADNLAAKIVEVCADLEKECDEEQWQKPKNS